ncbi:hypothetical protein DPMN_003007 [Dreissena polymorpha]|uniref:Uncharacterized protein n=1 Tax=Dreissena polymorpha TaxID=45954 RepID=A0A9D4RRR6_DREPO|nr:hypothetical protein DPMN_003007 [Dreissena polymorpha]
MCQFARKNTGDDNDEGYDDDGDYVDAADGGDRVVPLELYQRESKLLSEFPKLERLKGCGQTYITHLSSRPRINRYSSLLNLNVAESRSTPNKLWFIPVKPRQSPGGALVNAGGVPAERRFTNEPGYTGTLPAFTRAPPGHHRRQPGPCCSSAGVCIGPDGATVPSGLFPVPSRLFPVPRRSMPVLHGNNRFIPYMPPFEEEGVYCLAHVGLSVGPSTRWLSDDNSRTLGPRIMKLHRYIDHDW